jgi:hypothetical protein
LEKDLAALQAGSANPAMCETAQQFFLLCVMCNGCLVRRLDRIEVKVYGSTSPINAVAQVAKKGNQVLVVTPFDQTLKEAIRSAVRVLFVFSIRRKPRV